MPAPIGNTLLASASFRKQFFHLVQARGLHGGEIIRFGKILLDVIEFPDVLVGIPGREPGLYGQPGTSGPKVAAIQPS